MPFCRALLIPLALLVASGCDSGGHDTPLTTGQDEIVVLTTGEDEIEPTNQDQIVRLGLEMARAVQAWGQRPRPEGGGGTFAYAYIHHVGYLRAPTPDGEGFEAYHETPFGRFNSAVTTGTPGSVVITACNYEGGDKTTILIQGFDEGDIFVDRNAHPATCPS
ncbi:MAG: hypothetical protein AAFQ43_05575 [Bacteroidota bacterium]